MTPEAQRIAIAEACGYRKGENSPLWWARPSGQPFKACGVKDLPDYLNDLNAMHEAEKMLVNDGRSADYNFHLKRLCTVDYQQGKHTYPRPWHATAAQRAEAFLRTIGKWSDS